MPEHIVITKYKENILSLHFYKKDVYNSDKSGNDICEDLYNDIYKDNELMQINVDKSSLTSLLGNIYVGRVANIVKNINAAFVEIQRGVMCYYSLQDAKPIFLNSKNSTKIAVNDLLLVQVCKEAVASKVPVVTDALNITGKYAVLTHGKLGCNVSNKIKDKEENKRLKAIVDSYKNDNYGIILRTNAQGVDKEHITNEISNLIKNYNKIIDNSKHLVTFSVVSKTPFDYLCDIRDSYADNVSKIVTDDATIFETIKEYLEMYQPEDLEKLVFYEDETISLNVLYNIESKVKAALNEKVWLKSGGTIVIQPTVALVSIDVNTGKAIAGKSNVQKTFLKINLEAAKEIAKQLRLRNLGGIIIVDFIDLANEDDKKILLEEFEKILRNDPIKTILVEMTKLNLVELTRKKIRKPLHQQIKF